ncbi:MAG: KEOPS complex N(6)-L-threonylcarbamoyladenine synthase Kae1 [Candidatus Pacearchaeota archaeon]
MILAIESTAHTFGIAVINEARRGYKAILSNVSHSFTSEKGGIIPMEAAKHHEAWKGHLFKKALDGAGIEEKDINYIAFSQGPGLSPCLIIGKNFAKELALKLKLPIIPVNHCIAHLEVVRAVTKAKDPVLLYTSGANTQVIAYAASRYRVFGETLDIGVGNFLDSFARYVGIGFPGGPKIAQLAQLVQREKQKKLVKLPYTVKGMDVAFSGMLTNLKQKFDSGKYTIEELCYSLQEHAFAMLIEVAERAMAHLNKNELALGGGVACNKRLQEMARKMVEARKAKLYVPIDALLVDNAAMIGLTASQMLKAKRFVFNEDTAKRIEIKPYQRTDDVEVFWRE